MSKNCTIALFGEAEKGDFRTAYYCETLPQLIEFFGEPPQESRGLHFAVQTLLFHYSLIFFRVQEEGYSLHDYMIGIKVLERENLFATIKAIGIPGVGDDKIIQEISPLCQEHKSILLMTEQDLYDYLSGR